MPYLSLTGQYRILRSSAKRRNSTETGNSAQLCLKFRVPQKTVVPTNNYVTRSHFCLAIVCRWTNLLHDKVAWRNGAIFVASLIRAPDTATKFRSFLCKSVSTCFCGMTHVVICNRTTAKSRHRHIGCTSACQWHRCWCSQALHCSANNCLIYISCEMHAAAQCVWSVQIDHWHRHSWYPASILVD